ncbi:MAG: hypothetical protein GF334_06250 [Candidatus Altiarchaeales archaeon]|nr:hypothetical protein [Candidatus Altiarchaeales archaeon]
MSDEMDDRLKEYNEFMLKNAALTFSLEGLSKDLKSFLHKKISYNTEMMKHLTSMFRSVTTCEEKEVRLALLKEDSLVRSMVRHLYQEMRVTDMALNLIIQKLLERESTLTAERDDTEDSSLDAVDGNDTFSDKNTGGKTDDAK